MKLQDIDWPEFGLQDDVRPTLKALIEAGQPCALVTLFAADGGSPRGVGTQMLFGAEQVTGYLSGGCVEADVAVHAEAVMADGAPRRLVYGRGGPADVRLPCGGRIEAFVEPLPAGDPQARRLLQLAHARTPALWVTNGRLQLGGQVGGVLARREAGMDAAVGDPERRARTPPTCRPSCRRPCAWPNGEASAAPWPSLSPCSAASIRPIG